jgi:hypothetical protein
MLHKAMLVILKPLCNLGCSERLFHQERLGIMPDSVLDLRRDALDAVAEKKHALFLVHRPVGDDLVDSSSLVKG